MTPTTRGRVWRHTIDITDLTHQPGTHTIPAGWRYNVTIPGRPTIHGQRNTHQAALAAACHHIRLEASLSHATPGVTT